MSVVPPAGPRRFPAPLSGIPVPDNMPADATARQLAKILTMVSGACPCGDRRIDHHQITAWHDHRAVNGFPACLPETTQGRYGRIYCWDVMAAVAWLATWRPGAAAQVGRTDPTGSSRSRS